MDLKTEDGIFALLKSQSISVQTVKRLDEGVCGFVYRAELVEPLEDGSPTMIIKHTAEYAARARHFSLDPARMQFEHAFLTNIPIHLPSPLTTASPFPLRLPKAYTNSPESHTISMQDFPSSVSLARYLRSPPTSSSISDAQAIGTRLGTFLATIHNLTITHPSILIHFSNNDSARRMSAKAYFTNLSSAAEEYGLPWTLADDDGSWLRDLGDQQAAIVLGEGPSKDDEVLTVGDFWPGNVLITSAREVVPLDFELAKPGRASFDVGQMAAELWMAHLFGPWPGVDKIKSGDEGRACREAALAVLRAFLTAYKEAAVRDVDAAQVAIRVGAHLIVIGPKGREAVFGRKKVAEIVRQGVELCQAGLEGRRDCWHEVLGDF